jgi:hypothetical protein
MDIEMIQIEVSKVNQARFAHKTDKQLWVYQELYESYKSSKKREQPPGLIKFNLPANRVCKLTPKQVKEIRKRYIPYVYGKKRLANEYGVSTSVILRILKGKSWKIFDDTT